MDFDYTSEIITPDSTNILTIGGTGALEVPSGTTGERPVSVANGGIRYNTTTSSIEFYENNTWVNLGATPLTSKGDLYTRSSTADTRLPVGSNGQILTSDSSTTTGLKWIPDPLAAQDQLVADPTGFPNRTDSQISFNNSTRTFTIQPTTTSFSVYQRGIEYVKSSPDTVTISDVDGFHYIYYDTTGTLQESLTFYDLETQAPVSIIYWNSNTGTAVAVNEERHGLVMDWVTHRYLHLTVGARFVRGFDIGNYTLTGSGNSNTDAQIGVSGGTIADEDIFVTIVNTSTPVNHFEQDISPVAKLPVLYRLGTTGVYYKDAATSYPLKMGTTYPTWNEFNGSAWTTTEATSGSFIAMWVIATNEINNPVALYLGQHISYTINDAQTVNTFGNLNLGDSFQEVRPLYRLIFEIQSSYTNSVKAALRDIVDVRLDSIQTVITGTLPTGSVTSVGLSMPSIFTVTGTPVTSNGTLTAQLNPQNVNTFFAGPATGGSATPTFRTISLDEMNDVVLTTPTTNDILQYNGTTWVNQQVTLGSVSSVAATGSTGLTVGGSPITTSGTLTFTLDTGLQNLASFASTGLLTATGTDTWAARTLTGTANRITVTNGSGVAGNPTVDIASTYVGQNTITTLGTVTTGTWSATTIATSRGGTGLTTIGTSLQVLRVNAAGTGLEYATITTGGVTSVGLSLPSIFTVSGSPVTTTGTLTGTLATQSANTFFVGPASGGAATPTFRTVGIDELSDVVITSPTANQVIAYNGSSWVNTGAVGANATGTVGVSPSGGGTGWSVLSGNRYTANFVHNLGTTNLAITVYDTNDSSIVVPQSVTTPNANTITIVVTGNTRTLKVVAVANGQSIVAGGSTPSSVITAYEGVTVSTAATKLNFQGQAVGVTDAGSGTTNITVGSRFTFFAASLDTPVNSDFAVNSIAATVTDPTYASLNVRSFSNTTEQGVATLISIPTGATTLTIKMRGRAQTAPGTASVVQPRLYYRLLPNNSAVGAWSAAQELANISIPTNANFQYSTQTIALSTLGMTAGNLYQIELTRRVTGVTGTNLAANYLLAELTLELS